VEIGCCRKSGDECLTNYQGVFAFDHVLKERRFPSRRQQQSPRDGAAVGDLEIAAPW
jgi:hypothetical protein